MRNTHLRKRLERLETNIDAMRWNVSGADVHRVAMAKLSPTDRFLIEEVRGKELGFEQKYPATWERFEVALKEATRETGFPILFRASDWGL